MHMLTHMSSRAGQSHVKEWVCMWNLVRMRHSKHVESVLFHVCGGWYLAWAT